MSTGLAVNASGRPALLPLFVCSALAGGLGTFESSALGTVIPNLVRRSEVPAANAMFQAIFQLGLVVGPALSGLPSLLEGVRFVRGRQAIQGAFLIDLGATVFGLPRALFPALAATVFGGGATTLGLLYAAPGAGALIGALTTGCVGRIRRQAGAVTIAVIAWGLAIAAFGLTRWLPAAFALLAVAGCADVISAVFRSTIVQLSVPDVLRGRLTGLQSSVVTGGPRLGDLEAGAAAAAFGDTTSVISGGLVCITSALLLRALLPGFRRQRAETRPSRLGTERLSRWRCLVDAYREHESDPGSASAGTTGAWCSALARSTAGATTSPERSEPALPTCRLTSAAPAPHSRPPTGQLTTAGRSRPADYHAPVSGQRVPGGLAQFALGPASGADRQRHTRSSPAAGSGERPAVAPPGTAAAGLRDVADVAGYDCVSDVSRAWTPSGHVVAPDAGAADAVRRRGMGASGVDGSHAESFWVP